MIDQALARLTALEHLSPDEMGQVIDQIMQGKCSDDAIADFLVRLAQKGETAAELSAAALALRRHMTPLRNARQDLVDTCGPGGGGSKLFNVSTSAAIVAAAAGQPVAKHGNRSVTSRSGSADVLSELGVNIAAPVPVVERCLDELGIGFCFAPLFHPAMKHVSAVRKRLGVRTIFNLLGPLCNPAGAPYQLMGVSDAAVRPLLAEALAMLGARRALVVGGDEGLGELSLAGPSRGLVVEAGKTRPLVWTPAEFGLAAASLDSLQIETPAQSAALIRRVLAAEKGPARDLVVLNAAAALWIAGKSDHLISAAALAGEAIDSGQARDLLARWAELSHQPA